MDKKNAQIGAKSPVSFRYSDYAFMMSACGIAGSVVLLILGTILFQSPRNARVRAAEKMKEIGFQQALSFGD